MPGFLNNGVDDYINYVQRSSRSKKMSKLGSLLMYHNHDVEYRIYEGMTYGSFRLPSWRNWMGFTLDTY